MLTAEALVDLTDGLLQAVLDAQPDWVWIVDRGNHFRVVNEAMSRGLGLSRGQMIGRRPDSFVQAAPSPDPRYPSEDDWLMAAGLEIRGTERLGRMPDGHYVWWQRWKTLLRDRATGEVSGLVCTVRDITEQRELERAALEAAENERWRLGSELHDGAGGTLAGIDMMLSALGRRLDAGGGEAQELAQIQETLRTAMQELKGIARGLAPVDLEHAGLHEALRRMLEQVEAASGLRCRLHGDPVPFTLFGAGDSTQLYRIVQEAVTNVARHGRARGVDVHLRYDERWIELRIEDDGMGFDPATEPEGQGLRLMRYRARLVAGRLQIERRAVGGMRVVCRVPTRAGVFDIVPAGSP